MALVFVTVMIGTQLATPLLPAYGVALGVGVAALTAAYSCFLLALVPVLAILSNPRLQGHPLILIGSSLAVAGAADLVYLSHTYVGLLVGRVMSGVSLGLGAGAAATLTLILIGERGRTMVAATTIVGALLGTGGSIIVAELSSTPLITGFAIHLGLVVAVAVVLLITLRRGMTLASRVVDSPTLPVVVDVDGPPVWVGYVAGSLAFTVGGLLSALIPVATASSLASTSFVVANAAALGMLVSANVSQYTLFRLPMRWATAITGIASILGPAVAVWGVHDQSLGWIVAGGLLGGVGQGLGYRTGARIVTLGLGPRLQGARTSAYAYVTYGACAVMVLAVGAVLPLIGGFSGLWLVPAVLLVPGLAIIIGSAFRRRHSH